MGGSARFITGSGLLQHERFLRFFEEETEWRRLFSAAEERAAELFWVLEVYLKLKVVFLSKNH